MPAAPPTSTCWPWPSSRPCSRRSWRRRYHVHDRLHETDPAAFAAVAPRIRGIAASGESKVGAELIAQLPALEIISVMGVGYDGIDVAAAKARGDRGHAHARTCSTTMSPTWPSA